MRGQATGAHTAAAPRQRRQPEVTQGRIPELGPENVLRLHIAVNHPPAVRGGQRPGHAHPQRQQLLHRQRPVASQSSHIVAQREPVHHYAGPPIRRERAGQHRHNMGMPRQRPHRLALPLKSGYLGFALEAAVQHLDRHTAPELELQTHKHPAEPPTADLTQIPIPPNTGNTTTARSHLNLNLPELLRAEHSLTAGADALLTRMLQQPLPGRSAPRPLGKLSVLAESSTPARV